MVVGLGGMFRGLFHYWEEHISGDGAWWILALDGMLLIPLMFSLFFYPKVGLIGIGVVALLTIGVLILRRAFTAAFTRTEAPDA